MADLGYAIDAYIGHLAREGRQPSTLDTYRLLLNDFANLVPDKATQDLSLADFERFLNRWVGKSPSTLATGVSLVRGFSSFLHERGLVEDDVARMLKRPKRKRAEDLDVVTISPEEATRLLRACRDWQEIICIGGALYLGWRRAALNRARRSDVDLERGLMRVLEKGGKTLTKPIPSEYLDILREAEAASVWNSPRDYLIPNRVPAKVRREERDDKIIWKTVRRVAERAGVNAHVHSLRAAFAVQFLQQKPDQLHALQTLMGHSRPDTTAIYLRRLSKEQAMEEVRDLTFGGFVFESHNEKSPDLQGKAHTGFEPVFEEDADG